MEISMIKSGIRKLRENAQVAYIGSVNEEGFPQIKGMLVLEHESMQTHYFSTNTSSKRVAQFLKIPGLPYTMWTIPKISIGARSLREPWRSAPITKPGLFSGGTGLNCIIRKALMTRITVYTNLLPRPSITIMD